MKAQEEQNIIRKESIKSNRPVTHTKAMGTQTKIRTSNNRTKTDRKVNKKSGSQAWKTNVKSGGIQTDQTDSKSSNDDGTQTSVADGTGY